MARATTPKPIPVTNGWARLYRPTAFKLTLLITSACLSLRWTERAQSGSGVPVLRTLEAALGDLRFKERAALGLARTPIHTVVIEADEKSVERLGLWPWPRTVYAQLIERLDAAGAKAVVFDVGFFDKGAQGGTAGDQPLADAIRKSGKTVQSFILLNSEEAAAIGDGERKVSSDLIAKGAIDRARAHRGQGFTPPLVEVERTLGGEGEGRSAYSAALPPIAVVAEASRWFGFFNAAPDEDGVLRRTDLIAVLGELLLPSIDLAGYGAACGAPAPRLIHPLAASADDDGLSTIELGCAGGDVALPVERDGRMLLDYQVRWRRMPRLSAVDVLERQSPPAAIAGRVALIAATAEGTHDLRSSPLDSNVPGGVTHAVALEQMIAGHFFTRPNGLRALELLLLLLLGLGFGWLFSRLGQIGSVLALFGGLLLVHGLTVGLFLEGLDVVSALPLFQLLAMAACALVFRSVVDAREKRFITSLFGRYVSPRVRDAMIANPSLVRLGGEKRELTVLFSDVRGFTTLSEKLEPEQLVTLLNRYLTPMSDLVLATDGTVDKFMGDAIMAFWGAPLPQADHALRAVRTAALMMEKLAELRAAWRIEGLPDIDIGIGLNTGPMVVGNMGSENRFDYTVMGDAVNLGSRLEGTNKVYGTNVILSEDTERLVRGQVTTRQLDYVRVKGKHKPVKIFELIAVGPPPPEWAGPLADYELGVRLFQQRKFDEAELALLRVLARRPRDKPSEIYLDRCTKLRAAPPDDTWDGVLDLLTK